MRFVASSRTLPATSWLSPPRKGNMAAFPTPPLRRGRQDNVKHLSSRGRVFLPCGEGDPQGGGGITSSPSPSLRATPPREGNAPTESIRLCRKKCKKNFSPTPQKNRPTHQQKRPHPARTAPARRRHHAQKTLDRVIKKMFFRFEKHPKKWYNVNNSWGELSST